MNITPNYAVSANGDGDVHAALLLEHEKVLTRVRRWKNETIAYRWLNICIFMACKMLVPTGALIIAVNTISVVLNKPLLSNYSEITIAVIVTFLASLEAMLNPAAKKRLAFNLHNELCSIETKMNIAKISQNNADLKKKIEWANEETKKLLNHYSEKWILKPLWSDKIDENHKSNNDGNFGWPALQSRYYASGHKHCQDAPV